MSDDLKARLVRWVRPTTQPAYLRGGIDHPVVQDVADAADALDARDAEIARLQAKCRDAAKYLQWYHENSAKQHPTADSMISSLRNEKTRTALNGGDNERSR